LHYVCPKEFKVNVKTLLLIHHRLAVSSSPPEIPRLPSEILFEIIQVFVDDAIAHVNNRFATAQNWLQCGIDS